MREWFVVRIDCFETGCCRAWLGERHLGPEGQPGPAYQAAMLESEALALAFGHEWLRHACGRRARCGAVVERRQAGEGEAPAARIRYESQLVRNWVERKGVAVGLAVAAAGHEQR